MWCSTIVTANPLVKCIRFLRMLQQISHFVPLYPVIRLIRHYTNHVLLLLLSLLLFNFSRQQLRQKYFRSYVHSKILSPKWHTHTHPFNGPLSGTTHVSRYQKGETSRDFSEARDTDWQWHQLGRMQACTSLQTDNHASSPPLIFLQARCPSCHPTNSVKALKDWSD